MSTEDLRQKLTGMSVMAVFRIAVLSLLVLACVKIILPFLGALIWAIIIAISTWPAFNLLSDRIGQRRKLAAAILVCLMLIALAVPISLMILSLVDFLPQLSAFTRDLSGLSLPDAPGWVDSIPVLGPATTQLWKTAQSDLPSMLDKLRPALNEGAIWSLSHVAQLGLSLLEIVLAIVVSGVLLYNGEAAWYGAERTIVKLGGAPAIDLPEVVARTVRSVTTGVVGTALAQTLLCVAGLWIAGVPGSLVLGFLCFMLAVAQMPTLIVWLPGAAWVFYMGNTGRAAFLVLWGFLLVNTIDNFLKPMLISQGAKLPLSLIFLGVIGGLIAWGVIGLFIGPTLLAVAYTLFRHWLEGEYAVKPVERDPQ
ncbi:AI-2E family transporter [Paludibacterium yongneupense]|uniref:AI-2E family transporter n=1 Tax=Paludibacterium yongneupense TaxID=400061 RepID=UPI000400C8E6|nr:AI-2E family transporter [Paludibacterium yongneupense]